MSCADCVSRRQFLAAAASAAALAACGDGDVSGIGQVVDIGSGGTNKTSVVVASLPGLATVGTLVQLPGTFIAAKRTGAATFDAFFMRCTHAGCLTDLVGNQFDCPCHGSQFNSSGSVITGPAQDPLAKLPAVYDAATDTLTVN